MEVPEGAGDDQRDEGLNANRRHDCEHDEKPDRHALHDGVRVLQGGVAERELTTEAIDLVEEGEQASEEQRQDPVGRIGHDELQASSATGLAFAPRPLHRLCPFDGRAKELVGNAVVRNILAWLVWVRERCVAGAGVCVIFHAGPLGATEERELVVVGRGGQCREEVGVCE